LSKAGDLSEEKAMGDGSIRGFTRVSLSVLDLVQSRDFHHEVLGLPILVDTCEGTVFDGREVMVLVGRTALCLQEHRTNPGAAFEPSRTGLDHLSFEVPSIEELHAWAGQLTSAGVEHSGVKPLPGFGDFIELRDPDGIQLELHCLGTPTR
jgi:glyoxylase I family protein